jgi:hypothetical protein
LSFCFSSSCVPPMWRKTKRQSRETSNIGVHKMKTNKTTIQRQRLLSLSSVSKHNMWSYYDWVYWCFRPSVNTIYGRIMTGRQQQ